MQNGGRNQQHTPQPERPRREYRYTGPIHQQPPAPNGQGSPAGSSPQYTGAGLQRPPQNSGAWQTPPGWQSGAFVPQNPPQNPPPQNAFPDGFGVDPNLASVRSPEVYKRDNPFWEKPGAKQRRKSLKKALAALGVLALAALIVLYAIVFRVRRITVRGLENMPVQTVIQEAGLRYGESTLTLNRDAVKERVNANRYLIYSSLDVERDSVTLTVRERLPAAELKYSGIYYLIDREGMVLEETEDASAVQALPEVSGIEISGRYGCRLGAVVNAAQPHQMKVLSELLLEMKVLSADRIVTGIKLSDMDNILCETSDGYSVRLGDANGIRRKLRAMLLVRADLNTRSAGRGTIDVSIPETPTFIPES